MAGADRGDEPYSPDRRLAARDESVLFRVHPIDEMPDVVHQGHAGPTTDQKHGAGRVAAIMQHEGPRQFGPLSVDEYADGGDRGDLVRIALHSRAKPAEFLIEPVRRCPVGSEKGLIACQQVTTLADFGVQQSR